MYGFYYYYYYYLIILIRNATTLLPKPRLPFWFLDPKHFVLEDLTFEPKSLVVSNVSIKD